MTEQFYGYNAFEKGFYYDDGESCVPISNEDIVNQLNKYMKRNWELIEEKEGLKRTNSQLKKVNIEGSRQVEKLERENEQLKKENELKGDFRGFITKDIQKIKEENEQLKKENKRLRGCLIEIYTISKEESIE